MMGKQWPLSCYGPFRDKPCIPNFIEDQSFEEARFQCKLIKINDESLRLNTCAIFSGYEAKASGNVPAVVC